MPLIHKTYGKGRVRVMRLDRSHDSHVVRELTINAMLTGRFDAAFTEADNATSVSTDTVKNVVNVVARENLTLGTEAFCAAIGRKLLENYNSVDGVTVTGHETKWVRMLVDGKPHPHGFVLDSNGRPFATVTATRDAERTESGISAFTFMKTTASGWENYIKDSYTTLPETADRIAATAMDASWLWRAAPADYQKANALVLETLLRVFAETYSRSLQDSLYRMGQAVLAAVPEVASISLACPNKHYIPMNLGPFGMSADNMVFTPTDEPHGQIECVVGRDG